jgi:aspartyl-tRNA(Asn)/glutamyl-tRNA(Gln) amidotransferase subunit C
MKISIDDLAHLARLSVTDEEKPVFSKQIDSVLQYMEKLNELNTGDVDPTSHVITLNNVLREDLPMNPLDRTDALKNAPDTTEKFYRVPRIIE